MHRLVMLGIVLCLGVLFVGAYLKSCDEKPPAHRAISPTTEGYPGTASDPPASAGDPASASAGDPASAERLKHSTSLLEYAESIRPMLDVANSTASVEHTPNGDELVISTPRGFFRMRCEPDGAVLPLD